MPFSLIYTKSSEGFLLNSVDLYTLTKESIFVDDNVLLIKTRTRILKGLFIEMQAKQITIVL